MFNLKAQPLWILTLSNERLFYNIGLDLNGAVAFVEGFLSNQRPT